jgi:DOMON domain
MMWLSSMNRRRGRGFFFAWLANHITAPANAALRPGIRSPTTFFSGDLHDIQDYLGWLETVDYQGAYYLASEADIADGAAIHWSIDDDRGIFELAVAVRATGWLGFGISDNGGMKGSDVLLFEAINRHNVTDAHIKDLRYPQIDDCQNWEFVRSVVSEDGSDFLIVEVRRQLDTKDSQDWPIHNDANIEIPLSRIIAVWGDSVNVGYHGAKTARSTLRWYGFGKDELSHFHDTMEEKAVGSFMFVQDEYNIPPEETLYIRFCISANQMREQGVPIAEGATIIGLEPIITTPFVHHYTLYGSPDEHNFGSCENAYGMDLLYSWAPGM